MQLRPLINRPCFQDTLCPSWDSIFHLIRVAKILLNQGGDALHGDFLSMYCFHGLFHEISGCVLRSTRLSLSFFSMMYENRIRVDSIPSDCWQPLLTESSYHHGSPPLSLLGSIGSTSILIWYDPLSMQGVIYIANSTNLHSANPKNASLRAPTRHPF